MSDASRDQNNVATLLGTLNSDGRTIIPIKVSTTTHGIKTSDASTGSDNGPSIAPRDNNFIPALIAVSEVDGITPVVVYADSNGNLLIDSN